MSEDATVWHREGQSEYSLFVDVCHHCGVVGCHQDGLVCTLKSEVSQCEQDCFHFQQNDVEL